MPIGLVKRSQSSWTIFLVLFCFKPHLIAIDSRRYPLSSIGIQTGYKRETAATSSGTGRTHEEIKISEKSFEHACRINL